MRLNFFLLLIATGFICQAMAQRFAELPPMPTNDPSTYRHYPYFSNKKNLWGYADYRGRILIKPAFTMVMGFYKGFAGAKSEGGWGIVNEKGKWVIQPEYDAIECRQYIDAFTFEKKGEWSVKYIVNGNLSDQAPPSDDQGVVFEEIMDADSFDESDKPRQEVRQFLHEANGRSQLGEFLIRRGKPDSLLRSQSFNTFTIGQRLKDTGGRIFSLTQSDEGKKVGLLSWDTRRWAIRIVDPTYDSIWSFVHANPSFYGWKNGKVALINFDTTYEAFFESPPQFDDVKNWSTVYYVVRIGDGWYRVKHFGFYLPSEKKVRTEINPELIIRDVDDILYTGEPHFYLYKKNGLLGITINRNTLKASTEKDDWFILPPKFTDVKRKEYWFEHSMHDPEVYLFDVTLENGKKGPMTSTGVQLFD